MTALIDSKTMEITTKGQLVDNYGIDAVEAFIEEFGEECLESFEDAYQGVYDTEAAFTEDFVTSCYALDIPSFVEVDWQGTWDRTLQYDFIFNEGYVFSRNW